ncbi:MAG: hypothetical protein WA741_26610 [Candidatus Sulfotelmatobacter sp.]
MKMLEVQAGLGMGVKKFSVIFTFDNEKALNSFVNSGWDFGGQATGHTNRSSRPASLTRRFALAINER